MPTVRAAGLTHRGAVRSGNEDCIAVDAWVSQRSMSAPVYLEAPLDWTILCLVADGMGGHAAGEVASLMAAQSLLELTPNLHSADEMHAALIAVSHAIFEATQGNPALVGMGTTIAGVAFHEGEAFIFNVGDSRVYVQNGDFLRLLSTDDTAAADYAGSHERTGQRSHKLLQCLGGARAFVPVSPHVVRVPLGVGEESSTEAIDARFLLCSDGLTDMLDQDAIEACLQADPVATCKALYEAAMSAGGEDNISIIVADYSSVGFAGSHKKTKPA